MPVEVAATAADGSPDKGPRHMAVEVVEVLSTAATASSTAAQRLSTDGLASARLRTSTCSAATSASARPYRMLSKLQLLRTPARRCTTRGFATGKEIAFGTEARAAMLRGVDMLADAVQTTLGPKVSTAHRRPRAREQPRLPSLAQRGAAGAALVPTLPAAAAPLHAAAGGCRCRRLLLLPAAARAAMPAVHTMACSPLAYTRMLPIACRRAGTSPSSSRTARRRSRRMA